MPTLALAGLIALCFGLGAYYATDELGLFAGVNLGAGSVALLTAGVTRARRLRGLGTPEARRLLVPRLLAIAGAAALAVGLERVAALSKAQLDLTANRRFSLSSATRRELAELPGTLTATLYYDQGDPRVRQTRVLLRTLALAGEIEVRERVMDNAMLEVESFDLAASNTIVLEQDERFEVVERPSEATFLEGLLRLKRRHDWVVYVTRGEGEADFRGESELGFSGLASALSTRGYRLRDLVLAGVSAIPEEADCVLIVAPRRPLREASIEALRRYLGAGGSLVALLEPGPATGLEGLLAEFGLGVGEGIVIDPAAGSVDDEPPGVNPIVEAYADHPVTRGLGPTRMTYFRSARPVRAARKPQPADKLRELVYTSPRSWLAVNRDAVLRGFTPVRADGDRGNRRFKLAASGRYPRESGEARIVVFGDSEFASNQYLRALYNMDLVLNAIHWAAQREVQIALLPKSWTPDQRPLTPRETLSMLYAVGLLVPELLLIGGGVAWLRRRSL